MWHNSIMSSAPAHPSVHDNLTTLGEEVPLRDVGKALRALWADESAGKTRASLLNFAIYCEDMSTVEQNTAALRTITVEHACRSMLILNDRGAKPSKTTRCWVTAHCQLYDGRRSVCCEQISFLLPDGSADSLRSVLFSHLESDLPLVLWWQGELAGKLDESFYSVLNGLVVDSSEWQNPRATLEQLLVARQSRSARFSLTDLSWMRSHTLRLTLAAAFQNAALLKALPSMDKLQITYHPGHRTGASLLAAWLGTQLDVTLEGSEGKFVFHRKNGTTLSIELTEGSNEGCPFRELTLSGPEAAVTVSRCVGSGFVHAITRIGDTVSDDVQPAVCDTDSDLIVDQLSRLGGTTRYFETLPLFLKMLA